MHLLECAQAPAQTQHPRGCLPSHGIAGSELRSDPDSSHERLAKPAGRLCVAALEKIGRMAAWLPTARRTQSRRCARDHGPPVKATATRPPRRSPFNFDMRSSCAERIAVPSALLFKRHERRTPGPPQFVRELATQPSRERRTESIADPYASQLKKGLRPKSESLGFVVTPARFELALPA